jgi:hypothetical protein
LTRSRSFIALRLLLVFFSYHTALRAQSSSPDQPAPPVEQQPAPEKPAEQQPPPVPEKPDAPVPKSAANIEHRMYNRILGIIPNFIATEDTPENRKPLTPRQKYDLAFREMFDYSAQIGIGIGAAIDQGLEGRSGFGQGWDAYGKRFIADEAGNISGTFITTGFLPHILKQDPRFFRRGRGGFRKRAWYAFTRVVITRSDAGNPVFNTSNVVGSLAEDGISTLFYPGYNHTVGGTFGGWGFQMLQDGGFNLLSEFYPDIMDPILLRLHKSPAPHAHP